MIRYLLASLLLTASAHAQIAFVQSHEQAGTITTGGSFQQVMGSNLGRHGCLIQNTSTHTLYVYMGLVASATTAKSFQVAAGATYDCSRNGAVLTSPVAVSTSTTSDTFVWDEY